MARHDGGSDSRCIYEPKKLGDAFVLEARTTFRRARTAHVNGNRQYAIAKTARSATSSGDGLTNFCERDEAQMGPMADGRVCGYTDVRLERRMRSYLHEGVKSLQPRAQTLCTGQ